MALLGEGVEEDALLLLEGIWTRSQCKADPEILASFPEIEISSVVIESKTDPDEGKFLATGTDTLMIISRDL